MSAQPESILIRNATVYTPTGEWQPGWLLAENRVIARMGPGDPPEFEAGRVARDMDATGKMLLPGFIDLHTHGAMGVEVMDATQDGLEVIARFAASHGVTAFLGTTWTATREDIRTVLKTVGQMMGRVPGGATLLGVHLEGPYLNPSKCGAQDTQLIRRAQPEEALEFLDTGLVRLIAVAPEFEENLWLIDECRRRGITVSAGHTSANYEEMQEAVRHGVRQVTHCFNAMTGLGHRELGTVGAVMALPEINAELIADNIHVHPVAQKILIDVKGPDHVILITDAIRGTGMPDGEYKIDQRTITIRDGEVRLPGGTLAGSVLTMERALRNAYLASDRSLQEIWPMSSLNAARAIGISTRKGSLEVGKDADLVLLEPDFAVAMTIAEGEVVYLAGGAAE